MRAIDQFRQRRSVGNIHVILVGFILLLFCCTVLGCASELANDQHTMHSEQGSGSANSIANGNAAAGSNCFNLGVAIEHRFVDGVHNGNYSNNWGSFGNTIDETEYASSFLNAEIFNSGVTTNAGTLWNIARNAIGVQGPYDFTNAEYTFNFALRNGVNTARFGHILWHSHHILTGMGPWRDAMNALSPSQVDQFIDDHLLRVKDFKNNTQYVIGGQIKQPEFRDMVVLNEAFQTNPPYYYRGSVQGSPGAFNPIDASHGSGESFWGRIDGPNESYVLKIFRKAQQVFDEGGLIINDYDASGWWDGSFDGVRFNDIVTGPSNEEYESKAERIFFAATEELASIDRLIVGMQMHMFVPFHIAVIDGFVANFRNTLNVYQAASQKVTVTELDAGFDLNLTGQDYVNALQRQAYLYKEIIKACDEYVDTCTGVLIWGLTDANSWDQGNGRGEALLLGSDYVAATQMYRRKPAYEAVRDYFENDAIRPLCTRDV